ncbi:MAG: hypothetical protein CM1200mP41_35660 [Gammaproteobacteria bacterium]|nr:MAG: hypothetical protein CM1200mP41_35660 [Gammaproteobacteria bacterium]
MIEADEYDSAFFDKKTQVCPLPPPTSPILNNLEFDHGDIYSSIEEIIRQFHYLVRTVSAKRHPDRQPGRYKPHPCNRNGMFWGQLEWFDARPDAAPAVDGMPSDP